MTDRYVYGETDTGIHIWESEAYGAETGADLEWPCGSSESSGNPAACGEPRERTGGVFVTGIGGKWTTLHAMLGDDLVCDECRAAVMDRHNIPEAKIPR